MLTTPRLFGGCALILALILTVLKVPLASSQGLTLVAAHLSEALPSTEPDSVLWAQATAIEVPLSAQMVAKPYFPETRVQSVTARALHNDTELALLVEWSDSTRNDQTMRVQDFRDSVALQFPLADGQPYFCMGQEGGNVNIWHWKADWQADIAARQDMMTAYPNLYVDYYGLAGPSEQMAIADSVDPIYHPALAANNLFASRARMSPVEDIVAGGFSTLTAQAAESQNVQGYGYWADGKWRVIFSRSLSSGEADDVSFLPDRIYSIAFAVWDGSNGERNGTKSTSQWVSLQFRPLAGQETVGSAVSQARAPFQGPPAAFWGVILLFLLMAVVGWLIYVRLPE